MEEPIMTCRDAGACDPGDVLFVDQVGERHTLWVRFWRRVARHVEWRWVLKFARGYRIKTVSRTELTLER